MTTALATRNGNGHPPAIVGAELMEQVVIRGDLSKLTPAERGSYYMAVCKSVGLNPLTKPFEYITLNGKLTLYALRNCTDQLRSIYKISVADMTESERDGVCIVTCKVANSEGRTDIAKGAVSISNLKGENLANAIMKAETKAKRRATLSICGLGLLDETEVDDIPAARKNPHTTTPEDIVGEVNRADAMPEGDGRITPLPKKDTRVHFEAMQKEMHATKTPDELAAWGRANKNKKQMFKEDWQQILSGLYAAHMESLRNKAVATSDADDDEPQSDEPEKLLAWIDGVLTSITDAGMLEPTWNYRIEPYLIKLLPPEREDAMGLYRKHEARLSG